MTIEELIVKLEKLNACDEAIAFVREGENVERVYEGAYYHYIIWLGRKLKFEYQWNTFRDIRQNNPNMAKSEERQLVRRLFPLNMLLERLEKVE